MERQEGVVPEEALSRGLTAHREDLGGEIADCLAYLLKLANRAGIDLHEAYRAKMARNVERSWGYGDRATDATVSSDD